MGVNRACIAAFAALFVLLQGPVDAQEWKHSPSEIQQALTDLGFKLGTVDGLWGKKSAVALKAFQKAQGLPESGIFDEATSARLFAPNAEFVQDILGRLSKPTAPSASAASPANGTKASTSTKPVALPAPTVLEEAPLRPIPSLPLVAGRNLDTNDEMGAARTAPEIDVVGIDASRAVGAGAPRAEPPSPIVAVPTIRGNSGSDDQIRMPAAADTPTMKSDLKEPPKSVPSSPTTGTASQSAHNRSTSAAADRFWPFVFITIGLFALIKLLRRRPSSNTQPALSRPEGLVDRPAAAEKVREQKLVSPFLPAGGEPRTKSTEHPSPPAPSRVGQYPPAVSDELARSLSAHSTKVTAAIAERSGDERNAQPISVPKPPASVSISGTRWVPSGTASDVRGYSIRGGMIYVGSSLPKQSSPRENENCLVDPKLPIGSRGDPAGATMGYWPAYGQISPDARKSYLEWLAGPRTDPTTNIGYVFLYFYGLERRLLLDPAPSDAIDVLAEVRRLLGIYGTNGSFRRYANALISAYELKSASRVLNVEFGEETAGYDVPMSIKIALGQRLDAGMAVEPDLLLAFVMAHPETQRRTPARRVDYSLLKRVFSHELGQRFPKGIRISGKTGRKLQFDYHACSGTFDLEIKPFGLDLIDVTERKQPIGDARIAFEAVVDRLQAFSRALGKSDGLKPTLWAISKLPPPYCLEEARRLDGETLDHLERLAQSGDPVKIEDLTALAGLPKDKPINRSYVAELSSTLLAVGFGHTGDPDYATRWPKAGERVVLFPLKSAIPAPPSAAYKPTQLTMLLGLLMAFADGELQPQEKAELEARIDLTPGLSIDERRRLKAEIMGHAADPARLNDFTRKLKDVEPGTRERIADTLVAMAAADGTIHPDEVRQLEKLFRLMSLDTEALYARLHQGAAAVRKDAGQTDGDEVPEIIAPSSSAAAVPIPPPPPPPCRRNPSILVDAKRLQAIRDETRVAASLLEQIFADEAPEAVEPLPTEVDEPDTTGEIFEGLERRYGNLLVELSVRGEWAAEEFERLAREVGLMPAAAIDAINDWALDLFDELLIEGDDPVTLNLHLLPATVASGFEERTLQ